MCFSWGREWRRKFAEWVFLNAAGAKAVISGNITGGTPTVANGVTIGTGATQLVTVNSGTITGSSAIATAIGISNTSNSQGSATLVINSGVKLVNGSKAAAITGALLGTLELEIIGLLQVR